MALVAGLSITLTTFDGTDPTGMKPDIAFITRMGGAPDSQTPVQAGPVVGARHEGGFENRRNQPA